jgi:hypothetical protein
MPPAGPPVSRPGRAIASVMPLAPTRTSATATSASRASAPTDERSATNPIVVWTVISWYGSVCLGARSRLDVAGLAGHPLFSSGSDLCSEQNDAHVGRAVLVARWGLLLSVRRVRRGRPRIRVALTDLL